MVTITPQSCLIMLSKANDLVKNKKSIDDIKEAVWEIYNGLSSSDKGMVKSQLKYLTSSMGW